MPLSSARQDQIFYAGAGLLALVAVLFLGMLIAIVAMGLFVPTIKPLGLPQWFWFYRDSPYVMGWLLKGCGIAAVLVAGAVVALRTKKPPLHGDAKWASEQQIRREGLRADQGIMLGLKGGKPLMFGGSEHVLLEAPTRAGKGVGVVIPNLFTWEGSVVVLDVKQENWQATAGFRHAAGQRVLLFDPLDPKGRTARFNPLAYIDRNDEVEVINELQKIAGMLFPPPLKGETFWADAARTAFIGVGAYVASEGGTADEPGLPFTIGEIYRNLTVGDPKTRFPKIIERRAREGRPLSRACIGALHDFTSSSDNTFTSIRQSVTARIGLWINPYVDAATSESDFDFREFRSVPTSLFLGVSPDNIERVADLYNLLFQQLVDLNVRALPTTTSNNIPLLILLDEFARLGRATTIAAGFSYVAGYGIRLLPVIQSRSQLRAIYGKDTTDEMIANCGVEIVFTPKELEMANEISARLGTYTYKAMSRSHKGLGNDRSVSISDQRRALLLPQELMQFPKSDLILLRGGIPPVRARKITFYTEKFFVERTAYEPPVVQARSLDERAEKWRTTLYGEPSEGEADHGGDREARPMTDDEALRGTVPREAILDQSSIEALVEAKDDSQLDALIEAALVRGR